MQAIGTSARHRSGPALATATAVVAMIALMGIAAVSGESVRPGLAEGRPTQHEVPSVRAVAQALAAAARELIGAERVHAAIPAPVLAAIVRLERLAESVGASGAPAPHAPVLAERLLDLPPPRC